MPPDIKAQLDKFLCPECAETLELPCKLKLAIPHEATANLVVSLYFMPHLIREKATDIMVII